MAKIKNGNTHWKNVFSTQKVLNIIVIALFLVSWISFMFTPFTGDIKVFMAGAHQANYISGNLIVGAFEAWDLKGVFCRVLSFIIYKTALIFVPYNTYRFEVICKTIYSLLLVVISYVSMKIIFPDNRKRVIQNTIIISLLFMAMHTGSQMQMEMTVSLLILLSFALYLNSVKTGQHSTLKLFLSGLLIGTAFYFKSVLILLSVTVVAAVCIYKLENKIEFSLKKMMIVVVGSLVELAITAVLILIINPAEFQNMIDASAFQDTLLSVPFSILPTIKRFCYQHLMNVYFTPAVMLGMICLIFNVYLNIREKAWKLIFFHCIMWLMPALFIMLSNKYFIYHFVTYIFPSLVEIYYAGIHANKGRKLLLSVSSVGLAIWYIFLFSIFSTNVHTYINMDKQAYAETNDFLNRVNYDTSVEALYLDPGTGGYALGNPSYLKYFYPLPLQRLPEDSKLECHTESLSKAMEFDGKYISVLESWFFGSGKYQSLKDKILSEYDYIGSYRVLSPPFSLKSSSVSLTTYDVYERKN